MRLSAFNCLPLIVFTTVYFLTSYLGAALLLWGPHSARLLLRIYAGVETPTFASREFMVLMVLLHAPLLCMALAYMATVVWGGPLMRRFDRPVPSPGAMATGLLWLSSAGMSVFSLWRGGAFHNAHAWLSTYESWVTARWALFAVLSVPEFMNLYVFLPILSGLLVLQLWQTHRWGAVAVGVLGLALTMLLYMKKQPIVYLLILLLPFWTARQVRPGVRNWTMWNGFVSFAFAFVIYLALVFVPTLGLTKGPLRVDVATTGAVPLSCVKTEQAGILPKEHAEGPCAVVRASQDALTPGEIERDVSTNKLPSHVDRTVELENFRSQLLAMPVVAEKSLFLINSIIFRTAAPAIYYPKVFPANHPFYGLDLPFDRFTTDDNIVVWNAMWPDLPGGSVSAPFQFSIYAQVGIVGVMILSILTGITLALLWIWSAVVQPRQPMALMTATLTLVFTIFIAIDSLRNSVIASYGLAWGGVLLLLLVLLATFGFGGRNGRSHTAAWS